MSFIPTASSSPKLFLVRRSRPLNQLSAARAMPEKQPSVSHGCSSDVILKSKKTFSTPEIVSLGLILGGCAVTLLMVSIIEVRDGLMLLPVMVLSQYRRF